MDNGTQAIDKAIHQVERLLTAVTGQAPPPPTAAVDPTLPPEQDPQKFVDDKLDALLDVLGSVSRDLADETPALPALTVFETTEAIVYCLDVPGVAKNDVEVTFDPASVTVTARRLPLDAPHGVVRFQDVRGTVWRRTMALPRDIDAEKASVQLEHGVLRIHLPLGTKGRRTIRPS
jgi:HSP20 family protein